MTTEKQIIGLAELLMQSESVEASIYIIKEFGDECFKSGYQIGQSEAIKEIHKNYTPNK